MRAATLLLLLALPAPAAAQSWYVIGATLRAGGEPVGSLYGARVTPTGWAAPDRPTVRFADHRVEMEVELALADERTHVAVGVGRSARVLQGSGFRIEMRPLSWAPLLGRARAGVRVALPAGMPVSEGVIADPTAAPRSADAPTSAFSNPGPPDAYDSGCGRLVLRARPSASAPAWTIEDSRAALSLGPQRGRFTRARVFVEGFVVHGWLEGAAPTCGGAIALGGFGTACGDGAGGIVVTLPAGTALYASRRARRPFARLRSEMQGVEPHDGPVGRACTAAGCRRVPAEPTGPAPWILHAHGDRGEWLLTAWVRTPAEALRRPPDGVAGFGNCWSPPTDWPRDGQSTNARP